MIWNHCKGDWGKSKVCIYDIFCLRVGSEEI